jgi:AraC-like DNA-binding protein
MEILITILIYAGIVQGFYISFLLIRNKARNGANKYLAILLITMSLSIAHSIFVIPEIHKTLYDPYRIKEPFLMLVIPLIWLYVRKLDQPLFRFSILSGLHFLPFIIFMSVSIPAFVHGSDSKPAHFLSEHSFLFDGIIWGVILIQYSVYLHQILKLTRSYRFRAEQELSNIENVDIAWVKTFIYAFIIVLALLAIMFVTAMHNITVDWMNRIVSLVFSITVFTLGSKGLFQQSIFSNTDNLKISLSLSDEAIRPKIINEQLKRILLEYMDNQKPYRDFDLTLTSLAKQVKMNRNQLSEVINNSIGCSFYDFINRYRVDDVKQMLTLPSYKNYTLLAIAYEAGFPSKSTFNSIFKKFTGLTPSEYRNSLL